jgi:hypothetical protein
VPSPGQRVDRFAINGSDQIASGVVSTVASLLHDQTFDPMLD